MRFLVDGGAFVIRNAAGDTDLFEWPRQDCYLDIGETQTRVFRRRANAAPSLFQPVDNSDILNEAGDPMNLSALRSFNRIDLMNYATSGGSISSSSRTGGSYSQQWEVNKAKTGTDNNGVCELIPRSVIPGSADERGPMWPTVLDGQRFNLATVLPSLTDRYYGMVSTDHAVPGECYEWTADDLFDAGSVTFNTTAVITNGNSSVTQPETPRLDVITNGDGSVKHLSLLTHGGGGPGPANQSTQEHINTGAGWVDQGIVIDVVSPIENVRPHLNKHTGYARRIIKAGEERVATLFGSSSLSGRAAWVRDKDQGGVFRYVGDWAPNHQIFGSLILNDSYVDNRTDVDDVFEMDGQLWGLLTIGRPSAGGVAAERLLCIAPVREWRGWFVPTAKPQVLLDTRNIASGFYSQTIMPTFVASIDRAAATAVIIGAAKNADESLQSIFTMELRLR